jgi:competence/damage-inducible protein CinA-like protein
MGVEIIAIGSELLLGETADTNTPHIAQALRESGFDLQRATVVGDRPEAIVDALRGAADRADAVIVTGGLGPTVDDPTRQAAAEAAGVGLAFHPELWDGILARFTKLGRVATENNRQQAYLPEGAAALPNPNGTAPGFVMALGRSLLLAMPGVPHEMEAMLADQVLPALERRRGKTSILGKRTLHAGGLGESQIDELVGRWESMENPTVGLAAHAGMTDIRITARGEDEAAVSRLIASVEADIRAVLGEHLFGADGETLAGAVLRLLPEGAGLATAECGTGGRLAGLLSAEDSNLFRGALVAGNAANAAQDPAQMIADWRRKSSATHGIGLALRSWQGGYQSQFTLSFPDREISGKRVHLMPMQAASQWAAISALFILWSELRKP